MRIVRRPQEILQRHPRHFDRILKRQKQSGARAIFRLHFQQVLAVEKRLARRHLVFRMSRQRIAKRRFAGAVRPHDGMDFSRLDGQIDAI